MNKFDSIIKQSHEIKDFKNFDIDSEWDQFMHILEKENNDFVVPKATTTIRPIFKFFGSLAAVMIVVLVFLIALRPEPKTRESVTVTDEQAIIKLIDGTVITAKNGSNVDYPLSFNGEKERKVILDGNASFDVTRSILPFRVYFGELMVDVIGTSFSLEEDGSSYVFNIFKGVVKVTHAESNKGITLSKGDKYTFQNGEFANLNEVKVEVEEKEDIVVVKSPKVTQMTKVQVEEKKEVKSSVYKLDSVLKNFFKKLHNDKIKLDKKFKYNKDQTVKIDLNQPLQDVLISLKSQGVIDFYKGDCDDCYIIKAPEKIEK
ncbi:MAG: FecR domain-containing protein [Saprospiraceae bacterium]|nr:FecR domain-containing protein [Saprospiraceae bacterium]